MSTICVPAYITDSTVSSGNNAKTGLTPAILAGYAMTSSAAAIASGNYPAIKEGGNGLYYFLYDPEASGEAAFQVDAGSALSVPGDRFFSIVFTRDSSRILGGIDSAGHTVLSSSEHSNIQGDAAAALNAALGPFANLFMAATVSVVTSASAFTVAFSGSAPDAAGLTGLFCCVTASARAPEKQLIATAVAVDGAHVALTFFTAFGAAPQVGDSVLIG